MEILIYLLRRIKIRNTTETNKMHNAKYLNIYKKKNMVSR